MLLLQPVIFIQDERCYPNRWGKFPLKMGEERKNLPRKAEFFILVLTTNLFKQSFGWGVWGKLIN